MDVLEYFSTAHSLGLRPALLEFTHPHKGTPLAICGIRPSDSLAVHSGTTFRNQQHVGPALDIFDHLSLTSSDKFFPAWLGFFSYEFARYFGKIVHDDKNDIATFPDAYFLRYEHGLIIDDGRIIHCDALPHTTHEPIGSPRARTLRAGMSEEHFHAKVHNIKDRIRKGDVYQVNLSLPFFFDTDEHDMLALYAAMRSCNKSPFMGIMPFDDGWILSGSPERLFSLHNNKITARPIAGTKSRCNNLVDEDHQITNLKTCPKENAEHAMLVDLMRNDINRIATKNSVSVDEDRSVEFYSHVMHLVSSITATTTSDLKNIFDAIFPGGTITGAPKLTVMKAIAELEDCARGPYTGSLGYISAGYGVDFNILIRSIATKNNLARINAGAGIVIDSDEHSEWLEVLRKAQAIKDILEHKSQPKPARKKISGPAIVNSDRKINEQVRTILFIENHDSFSYNIVDALRLAGAHVQVDDDRSLPTDENRLEQFSHVVIGPGPGNPEAMPWLINFIDEAMRKNLPLLGICLGHQAIGFHAGARIKKLPQPVHGKPNAIHHFGDGLLAGLASPTTFTRYHSLAIESAPQDFLVDAYSDDDVIMSIRHKELPIFGVQFHPESYLSEGGQVLLHNFLRTGKQ